MAARTVWTSLGWTHRALRRSGWERQGDQGQLARRRRAERGHRGRSLSLAGQAEEEPGDWWTCLRGRSLSPESQAEEEPGEWWKCLRAGKDSYVSVSTSPNTTVVTQKHRVLIRLKRQTSVSLIKHECNTTRQKFKIAILLPISYP